MTLQEQANVRPEFLHTHGDENPSPAWEKTLRRLAAAPTTTHSPRIARADFVARLGRLPRWRILSCCSAVRG